MSKQSEAILEEQLVAQLQLLGYKIAPVSNEKELLRKL
jgi:type I restriction enzyme R subunit